MRFDGAEKDMTKNSKMDCFLLCRVTANKRKILKNTAELLLLFLKSVKIEEFRRLSFVLFCF